MTGPQGMGVLCPIFTITPAEVEFVSVGTGSSTTSGSLALDMPDGLEVDDVVLAVMAMAVSGLPQTAHSPRPSATGWTPYRNMDSGAVLSTNELHVLGRRIDGSEGSSVTFTSTAAGGRIVGQMIAFRHVHPNYWVGSDVLATEASDSTSHTPSFAVADNIGDMCVALYGGNGGNSVLPTLSPAQGFTMAAVAGAFETNYNRHLEIAYKSVLASGGQTAPTFAHGYTSNGDMHHIVLPVDYAIEDSLDDAVAGYASLRECYLKLTETSGSTAVDSSGQPTPRNGTYQGTITKNAVTGPDGLGVPLFTNGSISIPAASWQNVASGLTVFAIVRPTSAVAGRRFIITRGRVSSGNKYNWSFTADFAGGTVGMTLHGLAGSTKSGAGSSGIDSSLTVNEWNIVAASIENIHLQTDIRVFCNSGLDVSGIETSTADDALDNNGNVLIGDRYDGAATEFVGYIGRVLFLSGVVDVSPLVHAAIQEGWQGA